MEEEIADLGTVDHVTLYVTSWRIKNAYKL